MSFNKIIIVGNLGKEPELRYTPQGNAVCKITVATNEKRRDKAGDLQTETTWFRVTLWGKQAENAAKYLCKGSAVYLEGRLRVEEWQDNNGKDRYTLDVQATDMQFIASRTDGAGDMSDEAEEARAVRAVNNSRTQAASAGAGNPRLGNLNRQMSGAAALDEQLPDFGADDFPEFTGEAMADDDAPF